MAEMQTADSGGGKKKGGGTRSKKMSTRIDFTPMVDLGFLLITFFMLTTTLQKPQTMQIVLPEKDNVKEQDRDPIKQSKVLTLLLGKNDKVYWYRGIENAVLDSCDYSATGLRKIILDAKEKVRLEHGMDKKMEKQEDGTEKEVEKSHLVVLIKPNDDSVYKNMVDALDEMAITGVSKYVMMDISKDEQNFILNPAKGLAYKASN
jgi:biopolymer transport protein ExbD